MTLAENLTPSAQPVAASGPAGELRGVLGRMRAAARKSGPPDYDARVEHLDKLERAILEKKHDLAKAVSMDYGNRSKHETLAAEVMIVVNEIKHVRTHLHEWMETEPREVSWMFLPGRAEVVMQPVGVVGIVAPWNYPVQLSLSPLVNALAAGNRVMIKPSELAGDAAEVIKQIVAETFAADHVTVVTGGPDVAEAFTHLPFDHLVFTGSPRLGKLVMKAAAENLVPVTLELGGKSPAIVGEGYSLQQAAQKIMFGKCFNAGQTCVAPDYAILPKGRVDAFVEECRVAVGQMYPRLGQNPDYTTIISDAHYERLQAYIKDARDRGAKIIELNPAKEELDPNSRKMAPVLLLHPKDEMLVMQEEIFGPIMPIFTYEKLDDAIAYVNDHPRPLSLYYFDNNQRRIDRVLRETVSGGVTINDVMLHVAQSDLPFGGAGPSGIGAYHGREGFEAFTKKKPVFYQSRINATAMLRPPYAERIDWVLKMLLGK
ncbi:MAG: coniferyl aldehyde dehydrogenase [Labilithrix sp.]|nr:coniferyl aldehyde dehydrogenase [Labilithrix sp.]MCW5831869.1 coniferyl aldehyde dehydrogenase [Labilithrix sp.]